MMRPIAAPGVEVSHDSASRESASRAEFVELPGLRLGVTDGPTATKPTPAAISAMPSQRVSEISSCSRK